MLLGLKLWHACDAISVVAEFMVGVVGIEARHACDPMTCLLGDHYLTVA
jgi:hypothetical protein